MVILRTICSQARGCVCTALQLVGEVEQPSHTSKYDVIHKTGSTCVVNVKDQKVKGQGHKVTHKKYTQSRALALVTLESKRPLIVVVAQKKLYSE